MGEFVKSASSTVEPPVARKLRNAFASSGQGNASDSKKPGHTAKKPAEPASHSMPKPAAPSAPKPAAPAAPKPRHAASKSDAPKRVIARRVRANPASMAIVLTATPRVRRVETAASPVARRPFRELAPSMATPRRAATTPTARSRTPRDRAGQQSVQPQAGHAHPDSGDIPRPHPMNRPSVNNGEGRRGGRPGQGGGQRGGFRGRRVRAARSRASGASIVGSGRRPASRRRRQSFRRQWRRFPGRQQRSEQWSGTWWPRPRRRCRRVRTSGRQVLEGA